MKPGHARQGDEPASTRDDPSDGQSKLRAWFASKGWTPWDFQQDAWAAYSQGQSGLVQVPTGAGKTYAAFGGPLCEMIDDLQRARVGTGSGRASLDGLRVLYITPLRAVTRDIELALTLPIRDMGLPLRVESRTGDTSATQRARQRERLPNVLVTTPESLALLLTREQAREQLVEMRSIIVDEWHDLLVSKRGSSLELALARLRAWNPKVRSWALSATLPNPHDALATLLGTAPELHTGQSATQGALIRSMLTRGVAIDCIIPSDLARLPWAGHLGLTMLPDVLAALDPDVPTLVFTNTRSQAERWFHAIAFERPAWCSVMALHHGSIEREERERVEAGLKDGSIRLVIATSSLDLGVDFSPVQRVLQIGSPKGIARVVQRAGRANHRPGQASTVECVPTHALELLEVVSARDAFEAGELEPRLAAQSPLDVLAQHMVTCALGGGFHADALFDEVRTAYSYRGLNRIDFDWTLNLVSEGGVLSHYPQFRRIVKDEAGMWRCATPRIAQLHRLNVGTITGDASLEIRYVSGKKLGTIDEGFVTGLREGQKFVFAGKVLSLVGIRDLVVLVRPASGTTTNTPLWAGTRLPISESLGHALRRVLERAGSADPSDPHTPREFIAARTLVQTQQRWSVIPRADQLLCEITTTREGTHLFLFPFDGRLVHAGLAALLALRMGRLVKGTFSMAVNDYGLEILSASDYPFARVLTPSLLSRDNLAEDVAESVNMSQLARLAFREVARVAGLVLQNYPGARKTGRQVQASSSLIFDVYHDFDPGNLLLHQARREVLDKHFENARLGRSLSRLEQAHWIVRSTPRLTPLGFPLVVERVAAKHSSESIIERLQKMQQEWASG